MRLSRPCYDKIRRCPGWAGGGIKFARRKGRCDNGTIQVDWDNKHWKWRFWKCNTCDVVTWPYVIRYVDPVHGWYEGWRKWWMFTDSYRHYRTKVGCGRLYSLYRALYFELRGREPY